MTMNRDRESLEKKLKALFVESKKGNQEAYEEFLQLSSVLLKRVFFFCGRFQVNNEVLEDLHQEAMMKIHMKKHTYDETRPAIPWIEAIGKYTYIDYYRSNKTKPLFSEFFEENFAFEAEEQFDLSPILATLTPKQQTLLQMIKVEGKTYEEAAVDLNTSVSALKVSVHRILKSLKGVELL